MHSTGRGKWEQMGAATGLLATLLFVLGIVMGAGAGAQSPAPNIENAAGAPLFIALGLNQVRLMLLFTGLGFALFLWFLGSLWSHLKEAEGEPARGSTVALVGAAAGTTLIFGGLVIMWANALFFTPGQADVTSALYVVAALSIAIGGGVYSLFFFSVGKVIFLTGVLGRWLGWLAILVGLLCALTFLTPFFASGPLDAATGILGRYAWYFGFVIWVFLASLVLTRAERRQMRPPEPPAEPGGEHEPNGQREAAPTEMKETIEMAERIE